MYKELIFNLKKYYTQAVDNHDNYIAKDLKEAVALIVKQDEIAELEKRLQKYTTIDAISALKGHLCQYEEVDKEERDLICLHCNHMECMDYIRGTGICAVLEGETVILNQKCICPKDVYDSTETLLRANGKGSKCND